MNPSSTFRRLTRKYIFWVVILTLVISGFFLGYKLSSIPNLDTSKLLNIAGLLYSLIGVLVLSEMLSSTTQWKKGSVEILAPFILYLHSVVPFGALLMGSVTSCPSSATVSKFSSAFFAYSIIPLLVVDEIVVYPRLWPYKDIQTRFRFFGLYLVLSGIALQLIAAVASLASR